MVVNSPCLSAGMMLVYLWGLQSQMASHDSDVQSTPPAGGGKLKRPRLLSVTRSAFPAICAHGGNTQPLRVLFAYINVLDLRGSAPLCQTAWLKLPELLQAYRVTSAMLAIRAQASCMHSTAPPDPFTAQAPT